MESSTYNRGLVCNQLRAQHGPTFANSFVGDQQIDNNGQRHRPHALASYNRFLQVHGRATSGMGINKVQHPEVGISKVQQQEWITTIQHNELNIDMVKNIKQKNNELHNIVYNKVRHQDMESTSSTTSSFRR